MAKKQTRKPSASKKAKSKPTGKPTGAKPAKSVQKSLEKPAKKSPKKSSSKPKSPKSDDPRQRLQRVMASAGVGSRRECELIIEEGRVEVDGNIVMTLGAKVDPSKQEIYVDAQKLVVQRHQYFMLNKPPGILSTSKDPSGRPRVIDLIKTDKRVYNVGRLDQSSEGLILVTNDGDLANQLTHPRYGVEKRYHVQVVGIPAAGDLRKLEEGVYIAEGLARATKAKFLKRASTGCWLEIVLAEGRNREIRRMLAGIGHKVRTLKRVSIGPLKMGDLPLGAHRPLTSAEIKLLKQASAETKPRRIRPKVTKPGKIDSGTKKTVRPKFDKSDDSSNRDSKSPRKSIKRPSRHQSDDSSNRDGKSPRKSTKRPSRHSSDSRSSASGTRGAAKSAKSSAGRKKSVSKKPRRGGTNHPPKGGGSKRGGSRRGGKR